MKNELVKDSLSNKVNVATNLKFSEKESIASNMKWKKIKS